MRKNRKLPKIVQRFKEAVKTFREGLPVTVDQDDYLYRRLGDRNDNDLTPYEQTRHHKIAQYLYQVNPMCKRLTELQAEYMVGDGWQIDSENRALKNLLEDFWSHPVHDFEMYLSKLMIEHSIYGEQCWRIFTNELNGECELGYIDPVLIDKVVLGPNPLLVTKVLLHREGVTEPVPLKAVQVMRLPAMSDNGSRQTAMDGDTFFFKINSMLTASRGHSDYMTIFDLADLYDQFIMSRADRNLLANNVVNHFTINGADQPTCDEWARKYAQVYPNKSLVTNELVTYEVKAPNLRGEDSSFDDRTISNYQLGAYGFPEHFFGSGGDTNRATAMEMHEPVVKRLKRRQRLFRSYLKRLFDYVIWQQTSRGRLGKSGLEYAVVFPEVSYKDMQRSGLTMMYLAQSLAIAVENQWVTDEGAARIYSSVASGFGPDVEPHPNPGKKEDPDASKEEKQPEEDEDGGRAEAVQASFGIYSYR